MSRAYLGLGANLGQPVQQVEAAFGAIAVLHGTQLLERSVLYRSDPVGPPGQPDYCNAACAIETTLEPLALLAALQAIEDAGGRVRDGVRWAARHLDIDILHIEGIVADDPQLTLPHPQLVHRNWVLIPLAEIAPALLIPGVGAVATLAAAIGDTGLRRW